jgi:monoamine oxidase
MYSNYTEPKSYIEKDWISEQYSGGCFASIVGTSGLSKDYDFLSKPIDDNRIFISCSESSEHYYGYMEGAAVSGIKTALAVSQDR